MPLTHESEDLKMTEHHNCKSISAALQNARALSNQTLIRNYSLRLKLKTVSLYEKISTEDLSKVCLISKTIPISDGGAVFINPKSSS